ncbi:MAG: GyrI-like domain-containing protein [Candidatus Babeliales bacterium]
MNYVVKKRNPTNVIGISLDVTEPDQASYQIGEFWEKFRKEKIMEKIPNKLEPAYPMAVYSNYNANNQYTLILGTEVVHTVNVPYDMVAINIPAQTYGVFSIEGQLPDLILNTWQQIWELPLKRAYTYDFEVYKKISLDTAQADIYIALKPEYEQA